MRHVAISLLAGFLGALLAMGIVAATHSGGVTIPQGSVGGCIHLYEGSGNGTNRGSICVNDSIATDFTCVPTASGISCS